MTRPNVRRTAALPLRRLDPYPAATRLTRYADGLAVGLLAALVGLCWLWAVGTFQPVDFTDTGVGCIDDCLEPMIQDEADTVISQFRN